MSILVCSLDVTTSLQGGGKTVACPSGKGHGKKLPESCQKVARQLPESCQKVAIKLPESFKNVAI